MSAPENAQRKYLETNLPRIISNFEQFVAAHNARIPVIERTGAMIGLGPRSLFPTTADCLAGLGFVYVANEVRKINEQLVDWLTEIFTPASLVDQIAKHPEKAEQLLARCACYTDEQMTATPEQRLEQEQFFCLTLRDLAGDLRRVLSSFDADQFSIEQQNPEREPPAEDRPAPADTDSNSGRAIEALLGDIGQQILEIVHSDQSVDDKMRAICPLDLQRFLAYDSTQWSDLLVVSSPAIRQTRFWKQDRENARTAQAELERE